MYIKRIRGRKVGIPVVYSSYAIDAGATKRGAREIACIVMKDVDPVTRASDLIAPLR